MEVGCGCGWEAAWVQPPQILQTGLDATAWLKSPDLACIQGWMCNACKDTRRLKKKDAEDVGKNYTEAGCQENGRISILVLQQRKSFVLPILRFEMLGNVILPFRKISATNTHTHRSCDSGVFRLHKSRLMGSDGLTDPAPQTLTSCGHDRDWNDLYLLFFFYKNNFDLLNIFDSWRTMKAPLLSVLSCKRFWTKTLKQKHIRVLSVMWMATADDKSHPTSPFSTESIG